MTALMKWLDIPGHAGILKPFLEEKPLLDAIVDLQTNQHSKVNFAILYEYIHRMLICVSIKMANESGESLVKLSGASILLSELIREIDDAMKNRKTAEDREKRKVLPQLEA